MRSNPIESEKYLSDNNRTVRICQACGEPAILQEYDSGAPTVVDGHLTQDCNQKNQFIYSFKPSPFGVVVPQQSSEVIWEFQTNGLMCSHPTIRGTYIPLMTPQVSADEIDYGKVASNTRPDHFDDPVRLLVSSNYANNTGSNYDLEYIWDMIDRGLPFIYNEADPPHGYRETHEAWKWVEIRGSNFESDYNYSNLDPLIGERVLLVYPNSD